MTTGIIHFKNFNDKVNRFNKKMKDLNVRKTLKRDFSSFSDYSANVLLKTKEVKKM